MNDIEKVSVKDIFKKKTEKDLDTESVKEFGSAADFNGYHKDIYPHHQEDNIDRICADMHKKGKTYADWQKEKYRVTVSFPWSH